MATCKTLRSELAHLTKRQRAAQAKVRELNAEIVALSTKLPAHWVDSKAAQDERRAVQPLVDKAQKASDEFFRVNSDLVNKRAMVAATCDTKTPKRRRSR